MTPHKRRYESASPLTYDFGGGPIQTKPLQLGETLTFPVIFSVPPSAQPKELIFTLAANGERETSKDARVLLTEGNGVGEIKKVGSIQCDPANLHSMVNGLMNFTEYQPCFGTP